MFVSTQIWQENCTVLLEHAGMYTSPTVRYSQSQSDDIQILAINRRSPLSLVMCTGCKQEGGTRKSRDVRRDRRETHVGLSDDQGRHTDTQGSIHSKRLQAEFL